MKIVSWETITVKQFQDIYLAAKDPELDETGKLENLISILYEMPIDQVGDMTMQEFKDAAKHCAFAMDIEIIPGEKVDVLEVNGKRYGINYKIQNIKHRQYIETSHFGNNPIENMHLIMASVVQPINDMGEWEKNTADMHEDVSNDMLNARLMDVYHSCVFFCKLYLNLIDSIMPFLVVELMETGMSENQAKEVLTISQNILVGCITQERWQPLKV